MLDNFEKIIGKITISIIISIIFFVLCDHFLGGFFNSSHDNTFKRESNSYFVPTPYYMFSGSTILEDQLKAGLNHLGFRGPVPTIPKPQEEYRIAVIGGSTVLVGNPTLSEIIQNNFNQKGFPNIKVYNFGVLASVLRMDISRLLFLVSKMKPDLVIFYGGGNNIVMPYQGDPRPGYPHNFLVYESNPLLTAGTSRQSIIRDLSPFLLRSRIITSTIGDYLREYISDIDQLRADTNWGSEEWSKNVAESYLADLSLAEQISQALGAKTLFVFQPLLYYKNKPSRTEAGYFNQHGIRKHSVFCRNHIIQRINSSKIVNNFLDLSGIFNDDPDAVYTDGIHLHQEYFPTIGHAIFNHIKDGL